MAFSVSPHCCCFSNKASSKISLILSLSRILSLSSTLDRSCCDWSFSNSIESLSRDADFFVGASSSPIWSMDSCDWNAELDSCDWSSELAGSDWIPLSWEAFSLFVLLLLLISGCCLLLESYPDGFWMGWDWKIVISAFGILWRELYL